MKRTVIFSVFVLLVLLCFGAQALALDCVHPDFRGAEQKLGVSEQRIKDALGRPDQGPPDFADAARKLGITETTLRDALGVPAGKTFCPPPRHGAQGGPKGGPGKGPNQKAMGPTRTVVVHGIDFQVNYRTFAGFGELPDDITAQRQGLRSFIRPEGGTHYYQAVYVPTKNVSWVQAALLAESVGGYLASITSAEENEFVFSLVDDEKFFWKFPDDYTPDSHYGIKIGPFLGGAKTDGSSNSKTGWVWVSGEKWSYTNWCRNLDDGVIDKDPRPNDQPNGRGRQNIMGFGELNKPVPYWGDYFEQVSQYENMPMPAGYNYGFVIEWDTKPIMEPPHQ